MAAFGNSDPLRIFAMAIVYWLIVWPHRIFLCNVTSEILF